MSNYNNDLSGFLARNQRKSKPTDPDFSGSMEVAGVQYWLAGWTNEGKPGGKLEGQRYFSLKLTPKDAPRAAVAQRDDDMASTPVYGQATQGQPAPSRAPESAPLKFKPQENLEEDVPFDGVAH